MGQPSEGLPLQNTEMATSFGCDTSCFRGKVKNLFVSIAYQDRFDKNISESDG